MKPGNRRGVYVPFFLVKVPYFSTFVPRFFHAGSLPNFAEAPARRRGAERKGANAASGATGGAVESVLRGSESISRCRSNITVGFMVLWGFPKMVVPPIAGWFSSWKSHENSG